jgi:hypothetical protein
MGVCPVKLYIVKSQLVERALAGTLQSWQILIARGWGGMWRFWSIGALLLSRTVTQNWIYIYMTCL